jgi:hypothetical protein
VRVAFFTAGDSGAGHRARGIALGRGLARAGFSGTYRMFGPRHPFAALPDDGWEDVHVEEELLTSPETAGTSDLARRLLAFAPDVLVVDMFWAPLRHLLPLTGCEAWLLLRSFPPTWLQGPPGLPFDWSQYARIVSIEPVSSGALTHRIDPVVLVNPEECQPPGALRARLGVPHDRKLVAIMHAGKAGEHLSFTPAIDAGDEVRVTFDLHAREALFPIAAWLGDCDALHCAAGYNAFWEAHWLGYAKRTTFTALARTNDDPAWRIAKCSTYPMRENGADTLAGWIVRGR